jgi:selenide,water dikinase
MTNAQGRPGDVLVLTKPLGTGVIATALKAGQAPPDAVEAATRSMSTLNAAAAAAGLRHGVRCATDVTGFGLLGHAANIARESALTLEIEAALLPVLPHALALATGFVSKGLRANERQFAPLTAFEAPLDPSRAALLYDPQTSGGLLLLVPEASASALLEELPGAARIGVARPRGAAAIVVR